MGKTRDPRHSTVEIANVFNNFVNYESAKSASRVKLSSKIFHDLNPKLTEDWNRITSELIIKMVKQHLDGIFEFDEPEVNEMLTSNLLDRLEKKHPY